MTQPPDWAIAVPSTPGVHPSTTQDTQFTPPFTQQQLLEIGAQFIEQFVGVVVKALVGAFIPGASGAAFDQLTSWANGVPLLSGGFLSSGVIPGLDASKIISGIFGTGVIPGLDTSKIISGTFPLSIVSGLLGLFGGATNATQANNYNINLLSLLNNPTLTGSPGSFDPIAAGVSLLDDFLPGLTGANGLFNGLFGGITKLGGTGRTRDEANTAISSQADTVIGTAATMEQILAALGSGTPDADDFERTNASNLGANWGIYQTGTGTLATPNGHDASFSGSGNVEYVARKTDKQAATDHQTVTMVLATGIPSYPLFTPLPYGGNNDLWLRMTGFTTFATRTGLRFRVNGNAPYNATWSIDWVVSGTATNLGSGSMSIPSAGASISFEAGVTGNMRHYTARLNGTVIAGTDITDTADRGFGNTFRGFGGKGASGIGLPQGTANLKQWTAQG